MYRRPFNPPLLQRRSSEVHVSIDNTSISDGGQPPAKKLRTGSIDSERDALFATERKQESKPFKVPKSLHGHHSSSGNLTLASKSSVTSLSNSTSKTSLVLKTAQLERTPLLTISNGSSTSSESQSGLKTHSLYKQTCERPFKKPSVQRMNEGGNFKQSPDGDVIMEGYYSVLWRKPTNKKHKTWDGDGILSVINGYANLQDISGRELGRSGSKLTNPLLPECKLNVGGKEIEIDSVISKADFMTGKPFLGNYMPGKPRQQETQSDSASKEDPINVVKKRESKKEFALNGSKRKTQDKMLHPSTQFGIKQRTTPVSTSSLGAFRPPFLPIQESDRSLQQTVSTAFSLGQMRSFTPRHDPLAPGALVMPRPLNGNIPKGKYIMDVVVDPLLAKNLRPHQREGVQFLYECVMGMKGDEVRGAILADEMGLGKTLQTIALVWTLLKQNPLHDERDAQVSPVVRKVLIVCPVTLIANWRKEFRKWLGLDRIGVYVAEDKHARLTDFTMGKAYSVMIVGYEKLRKIQDELKKGSSIDLIIADEGHRLKTAQNKALLAIKSFDTDRRILLTGTPMQNALKEMYETVDLVNPGVLGKYNTFKREFETPILKSRQPEATKREVEKGEARNEELLSLTGRFILRRTADVIAKFLPPKTEIVVFCKPTYAQAEMYKAVLRSPIYSAALGSSEMSLQLINVLKKLCNGPSLMAASDRNEEKQSDMITSLVATLPAQQQARHGPSSSTKLQFLDTLLHQLQQNTEEKIVLVSNYTTTLDMIQRLLTSLSYPFLRLDGKTPTSKRQGLVDQFNKASPRKCFCFLLSTKAGGTGLNLIGASRLVLFDVDWNPAHDLQAMARIHRDGQRHPCFIYRLVVAGTLEEKIYQRQVTKTGLSDAVVDAKKTVQAFSSEELRKLFMFEEGDGCATHDLMNCECGGDGNEKSLRNDVLGEDLNTNELEDDEQDYEEDLPPLGVLISAAKLDVGKQEEHVQKIRQRSFEQKRKGKKKMLALMQYVHIDVKKLREGKGDLDSLVEDLVLLESLKDANNMVSYMFSKTTG